MTTMDTEILADAIREKHRCLVQLRDMGRRQLELIDVGNMTGLLDVLAAKQRTLSLLQGIERRLEPFRNQAPETRRWPAPEARAACAEQLRQCEALLSEIVCQEKFSESVLVRRRDEAAERLRGVNLAGQARGAYALAPHAGVHQVDLLSDR